MRSIVVNPAEGSNFEVGVVKITGPASAASLGFAFVQVSTEEG